MQTETQTQTQIQIQVQNTFSQNILILVRDDRLILVTDEPRRKVERLVGVYRKFKLSTRMKFLSQYGNVIYYGGRRQLPIGIYTMEEFRKVIENLTEKWKSKLEEFLEKPITKEKIKGKKLEERKEPVEYMVMDVAPHLRRNRFGFYYRVPRPIEGDWVVDYEDYVIVGWSQFSKSLWLWIQGDDYTEVVIIRDNARKEDIERIMGNFRAKEIIERTCEEFKEVNERICKVLM